MGSVVRVAYEDLGLGTYGVSVEDGAMVGCLRDCGGQWAYELFDEASGTDTFAQGQRVGRHAAEAAILTACIDRIAGTIR